MKLIKICATLLLGLATSAHAGVFDCLPSNLAGTGTKVLLKSVPKGDFAAWYCPGKPLPNLVVCTKAACSLVGYKRAVAALVNDPSLAALNAAMKAHPGDVWRDPALVAVWEPHTSEIRALVKD